MCKTVLSFTSAFGSLGQFFGWFPYADYYILSDNTRSIFLSLEALLEFPTGTQEDDDIYICNSVDYWKTDERDSNWVAIGFHVSVPAYGTEFDTLKHFYLPDLDFGSSFCTNESTILISESKLMAAFIIYFLFKMPRRLILANTAVPRHSYLFIYLFSQALHDQISWKVLYLNNINFQNTLDLTTYLI